MSIVAECDPFPIGPRSALFHRGPIIGAKGISEFAVHKVIVCFADDVFFGRAKEAFKALVAQQKDALLVLQPDQVGNRLNQ